MIENLFVESMTTDYNQAILNTFGTVPSSYVSNYIKLQCIGSFEGPDILDQIVECHLSKKYSIAMDELRTSFPEKFV